MDNAVKYTTPPGNIQVVLRESGSMLVIEVRDSGIGISPSDLPHIFKRFYRGEQSRSQIDGSGLGLAIAHWIADTHQAELSAEGQEHGGTVFRISIPVLQRSGELRPIASDSPDPFDRKPGWDVRDVIDILSPV